MLLTAMLLSLIHRSSHSRLQSHSRKGVWNSLHSHAALKRPHFIWRLRWPSSRRRRVTYRDLRDTRLSKVPGAMVEKTFPERFLETKREMT